MDSFLQGFFPQQSLPTAGPNLPETEVVPPSVPKQPPQGKMNEDTGAVRTVKMVENMEVEQEDVNTAASTLQSVLASPLQLPAIKHETHGIPAVPDYVPAEMFLENIGYFTPSSKRIRRVYTKEKVIGQKIEPNGTKRMIKTKISANHELGLPITSDLDYYRAFLKICDEIVDSKGRIHLPVAVPTKKLIRYAGKQVSQRAIKEAKEWLKRMTATFIEGGIYRAKMKGYQDGFFGTVFSQVVIKGEQMKDGRIAETNYVWLAPWFLANYFHHYVRPVDLNFHCRLSKPIAKSLYPLLETGWYASNGKPYEKSYHSICEEFLLTEYQRLGRIKQQLDPAHQELERECFLAKWAYRQSADKQGYTLIYYPGEKFFADQQAREERRRLAEHIEGRPERLRRSISEAHELSSAGEGKARKELLVKDIIAVTGDPKSQGFYVLLVQKVEAQTIYRALAETKEAARERKIRTTSARYFTYLIKRYADEQGVTL